MTEGCREGIVVVVVVDTRLYSLAVLSEKPPEGMNGAEFWCKPEPPGLSLARLPEYEVKLEKRRMLSDVVQEQEHLLLRRRRRAGTTTECAPSSAR